MKNLNNIKKLALTLLISGLFAASNNSFGMLNPETRALFKACEEANLNKVQELLSTKRDLIDINFALEDSWEHNKNNWETPLSFAMKYYTKGYFLEGAENFPEIIKLLIIHGAKINNLFNKYKNYLKTHPEINRKHYQNVEKALSEAQAILEKRKKPLKTKSEEISPQKELTKRNFEELLKNCEDKAKKEIIKLYGTPSYQRFEDIIKFAISRNPEYGKKILQTFENIKSLHIQEAVNEFYKQ